MCYTQKSIVIINRKVYIASRGKSIMACDKSPPIGVLRDGRVGTLVVRTSFQEVVCH